MLPPIVDGVKSLIDWFTKLPEPVQLFAGILGVLSVAFLGFTPIVAALAISFMALDVALLPIIGIIVGLTAVITGIIVVIQNWGAITDWLSEKWSQFKDWFGELWSGFVQVCSEGWSSTVTYFSEAWSSFVEMMHSF